MKKLFTILTLALCIFCMTATSYATYRIQPIPGGKFVDIGGDCDQDDICWCEGPNQICWEHVALATLMFGLLRVDVTCEEDGSPAANVPIEIWRHYLNIPIRKAETNDKGRKWFGLLPGDYDIIVNGEEADNLVWIGMLSTTFKSYTTDCYPDTTTTIKPTTTVPITTTSIKPTTTSVKPTTTIPNVTTTIPNGTTTIPNGTTTVCPTTTAPPTSSTSSIMGTSTTTEPPVTTTVEPTTTTTICKEDRRRCELQCKDQCDLKPFAWVMTTLFPQTFHGIGIQGHERNECYRECMQECTPLNHQPSECTE